MTATIIDFSEKRRERDERERCRRIDTFDRELRRRLAVYLEGNATAAEAIKDSPHS
jgi:hypothetical protein